MDEKEKSVPDVRERKWGKRETSSEKQAAKFFFSICLELASAALALLQARNCLSLVFKAIKLLSETA